jgi:hypothetical protein
MSLEYYLFCRENVNEIITNLENIVQNCEIITHNTDLELEKTNDEIFLSLFKKKIHKNFFSTIEQFTDFKQLKKLCDDKIVQLCSHEFVDDSIDIDPDRSENITYCTICGFTK